MDPDLFECPVCTDIMKSPILSLDCGHSFCKQCVINFRKNSKVYKCPLCSKKQTKAIDQLPRNWTIEAAVQKLESLDLEPTPVAPAKQFCKIHTSMEISLGCIKCENTICFQCFYLATSKGKDMTPCCAASDYKPLDEFYKKKAADYELGITITDERVDKVCDEIDSRIRSLRNEISECTKIHDKLNRSKAETSGAKSALRAQDYRKLELISQQYQKEIISYVAEWKYMISMKNTGNDNTRNDENGADYPGNPDESPEEWEAVENQSQWEADPTIDDRQRERTVSGSYAGAVSLDNSTDFPTIGDQSNAKKISAALTQPPQIPRARTVSGGHKTEIPVSYVEGAVCRNFFRYI